MKSVAAALEQEIRGHVEPLLKALSQSRSQLAVLRQRVQALEREMKRSGGTKRHSEATGAKGLARHRQRLGISAATAGRLLGVTRLSIYNWESGKTRPQAKQLPGIAALRKTRKRDVAGLLEQVKTARISQPNPSIDRLKRL